MKINKIVNKYLKLLIIIMGEVVYRREQWLWVDEKAKNNLQDAESGMSTLFWKSNCKEI